MQTEDTSKSKADGLLTLKHPPSCSLETVIIDVTQMANWPSIFM
jgi:hypothetical protein